MWGSVAVDGIPPGRWDSGQAGFKVGSSVLDELMGAIWDGGGWLFNVGGGLVRLLLSFMSELRQMPRRSSNI